LFKDRTDEKREKWKRLDKVAKSMIKFEQKKTWEKFVLDLEQNYKDNKKLLYAVMRNKRKPKSEISKILD
jgi:ribosomal protein S17E